VLTGDLPGAIITSAQTREFQELNPLVQVVWLSGAGHNVCREQFEAYVQQVRRFLSE
jgi:pimeloyl-ACP methyl ester carboxylesterase